MNINEIKLRNFKSYGNKEQTIKFGENELILLAGKNGSGKSTWKNAIELLLFRKCSGRKNKRLSLQKLPNRFNKALYSYIDFDNNRNENIKITTNLSPQKFEIFIDGEPHHNQFKNFSEKEKDDVVGFSYDMFKSFISVNMNDFRDFVSLNKEDKENLLNKLFGLEKLDKYYSITKTLSDDNTINLNNNLFQYEQLQDKIRDYKNTLSQIESDDNINEKIEEITNNLLNSKPTFIKYDEEIKKIDVEINEFNLKFKTAASMKTKNINERNKLDVQLSNLNEKLNVFNSGTCPVCDADLSDENHKKEHYAEEIDEHKNKIKGLEDFYQRILTEESAIRNKKEQKINEKRKIIELFNQLKIVLGSLKSELNMLRENKKNNTYSKINDKLEKLETEFLNSEIMVGELQHKQDSYNHLLDLFKGTKIRSKIISSIINPVNVNLQDYLSKLNYKYRVKLNNNFDAELWHRYEKIDVETLSKGESHQINLAIALSYLDIILSKKNSNLMFLDEVFDGIDVDNIELILKILRELIHKYGVNIIVVHHGSENINLHHFDRMIKVQYDGVFSDINDVKLN